MIGRLTGILLVKEPPALLVDVGGVGYELEAPMTTFYDLPARGEQVTLHTHMVVREDAQLLYGFSKLSQRQLFRDLLRVNGVGPRMALAVLSGMSDQEFADCVFHEDVTQLTKVPGVGKKTAERLIIEMRDKVKTIKEQGASMESGSAIPDIQDPVSEAVSALVSLGYKSQEASKLVRGVDTRDLSTEEIIREALRSLSSAV
jgi:Holliday junction DNA helicase RuvA